VSPRERRLRADLEAMHALVVQAPAVFAFETSGSPPDHYCVELTATGVARGMHGGLVLRDRHRFDAYLHLDYPRQAPLLRWATPIFHPNILPPGRNGGVCIGAWSASESLADLCHRIARMVRYERFSVGDALDTEAAAWAAASHVTEGADLRALLAAA
jgi:ubiquitin-protein ligase